MTELKPLTPEEFAALKPMSRRRYVAEVYVEARKVRYEAMTNSPRRGTTQGNAFLWISLYGKGSINTMFRNEVKRKGERIMQNYRWTRHAWYFGSQSDLGHYDGLKAMSEYLTKMGISALLDDEWD